MIKTIKQNKKYVLMIGVIMLFLGTMFLPAMLSEPVGKVSGGFMRDGEKVDLSNSISPLIFRNDAGSQVDEIWARLEWTVQGEDVIWNTFHIIGNLGIKLHRISSDPIVLKNRPFDLMGEACAFTSNYYNMYELLEFLLDGQPWTDPSNPTYWDLYIYGNFVMYIEDTYGQILDDSWSGESTLIRVNWV